MSASAKKFLDSKMSQHGRKSQTGKKKSGPSQSLPKPTGPNQSGPKSTRSNQSGPNKSGPKSTRSNQSGPKSTRPNQSGPKSTGPNQSGPKPAGPNQAAPKPTVPNEAGPKPTVPNQSGPKPAGPMESGPKDAGHKLSGPNESGQKESGRKQSGPHETAIRNFELRKSKQNDIIRPEDGYEERQAAKMEYYERRKSERRESENSSESLTDLGTHPAEINWYYNFENPEFDPDFQDYSPHNITDMDDIPYLGAYIDVPRKKKNPEGPYSFGITIEGEKDKLRRHDRYLDEDMITKFSQGNSTYTFSFMRARNKCLANIDYLQLYPDFKAIDLSRNRIHNVLVLSEFHHIRIVNLELNYIANPVHIPTFIVCHALNLMGNCLITTKGFHLQPKLHYLNLNRNKITDVDGLTLAAFPELRCLELRKNNLTSLKGLKLPKLKYLYVAENKLINTIDLKGVPNIVCFHARSNKIQSLWNFPTTLYELKYLNLRNNFISKNTEIIRLGHSPLRALILIDNPIARGAKYRSETITSVLSLVRLDKTKVTQPEIVAAVFVREQRKVGELAILKNDVLSYTPPPTPTSENELNNRKTNLKDRVTRTTQMSIIREYLERETRVHGDATTADATTSGKRSSVKVQRNPGDRRKSFNKQEDETSGTNESQRFLDDRKASLKSRKRSASERRASLYEPEDEISREKSDYDNSERKLSLFNRKKSIYDDPRRKLSLPGKEKLVRVRIHSESSGEKEVSLVDGKKVTRGSLVDPSNTEVGNVKSYRKLIVAVDEELGTDAEATPPKAQEPEAPKKYKINENNIVAEVKDERPNENPFSSGLQKPSVAVKIKNEGPGHNETKDTKQNSRTETKERRMFGTEQKRTKWKDQAVGSMDVNTPVNFDADSPPGGKETTNEGSDNYHKGNKRIEDIERLLGIKGNNPFDPFERMPDKFLDRPYKLSGSKEKELEELFMKDKKSQQIAKAIKEARMKKLVSGSKEARDELSEAKSSRNIHAPPDEESKVRPAQNLNDATDELSKTKSRRNLQALPDELSKTKSRQNLHSTPDELSKTKSRQNLQDESNELSNTKLNENFHDATDELSNTKSRQNLQDESNELSNTKLNENFHDATDELSKTKSRQNLQDESNELSNTKLNENFHDATDKLSKAKSGRNLHAQPNDELPKVKSNRNIHDATDELSKAKSKRNLHAQSNDELPKVKSNRNIHDATDKLSKAKSKRNLHAQPDVELPKVKSNRNIQDVTDELSKAKSSRNLHAQPNDDLPKVKSNRNIHDATDKLSKAKSKRNLHAQPDVELPKVKSNRNIQDVTDELSKAKSRRNLHAQPDVELPKVKSNRNIQDVTDELSKAKSRRNLHAQPNDELTKVKSRRNLHDATDKLSKGKSKQNIYAPPNGELSKVKSKGNLYDATDELSKAKSRSNLHDGY